MKSFLRIFKYILPQWRRMIVIGATAVLIGILFSLSFATVVPLLKVMMGEEGLHGWVDRKICKWRYGVEFYVPETTDFTEGADRDIAHYLRIIRIDDGSAAEKAGLKPEDRIVGVGAYLVGENVKAVSRARLLEELATTEEDLLAVQLRRLDKEATLLEQKQVQLGVPAKAAYMEYLQKALSFMPRGDVSANKERAVVLIIILMVAVTIVRCVARFYQNYLAEKVVQFAIAEMREDAFAHAMEMPVGFFASEGTSDTVSRMVTDISGMGKGVKVLLGKALREPIKAFFILACAMWISLELTLIFMCGAVVIVVLAALLGKKIKKYSRRSLQTIALMLGKLEETIAGLPVVKVYNRQQHERLAYRGVNRRFLRHTLRIAKVKSATGPVMEVLGVMAGSAALLVGAHWVTSADMQASMFFGLLVLLGAAAESVRKTSDVWNKIQQANAAAERVFSIVDEPAESEKPGAVELPPLKEKIVFQDVRFTYPKSDTPALKGINLEVRAGQNLALVGPNGAGKTTLVNLIPRFYNVDGGSILIDDVDVRECTLRSLRSQIGLVGQNVVTFNDTIAANIAYGKKDASMHEVVEAARHAFVHEFVTPLPDGYETVIGEHGAGFSGGQLQRIAIARAILKNPPILIFDEATSQVDADSEAKIHKALSELMQNRTCFVIAHRFSTLQSADTIVVMNDGRIVAQGAHDDLIKTCSVYQSLYETQMISSR